MSSKVKDTFHLMVDIADDKRVENELRFAVDYLSANRLSESAKWVSELLSSMKNRKPANFSLGSSHLHDSNFEEGYLRGKASDNYEMEEDEYYEEIDPSNFRHDIEDYPIHKDEPFSYTFYERKSRVNDVVNLARSLFDLREYRKACHKLKPYLHPMNQSAIFIYYYSLYMLSEQQSEEEKFQSTDNISRS